MKKIRIQDKVRPYLYVTAALCLVIVFYKLVDNIGVVIRVVGGASRFLLKVLNPLIWSIVLAYFLNRPVIYLDKRLLKCNFFKRHIRLSRALSLVVVYSLLIGIFYGIMWYVIPQIWASVNSIAENMPYYIMKIKGILEDSSLGNAIFQQVNTFDNSLNFITKYFKVDLGYGDIIGFLLDRAINITALAFNITLAVFLSIYLLLDKEVITRQFSSFAKLLISKDTYEQMTRNIRYMDEIFYNYIIGKVYCSIIISVIVFLCLFLMKVPHLYLISILIGVLNIIPYFGPIIAGTIGFIITWLAEPTKALWVVVLIFVTQELEDNFLTPKIIGDVIGLKPFWIMLAVILGGEMLGILGMFVAIPLFAILRVFASQEIIRRRGR